MLINFANVCEIFLLTYFFILFFLINASWFDILLYNATTFILFFFFLLRSINLFKHTLCKNAIHTYYDLNILLHDEHVRNFSIKIHVDILEEQKLPIISGKTLN